MATPRIAQFMRFCVVGGLAFVLDVAILEFLVLGNVPALHARVISMALAMQLSYALHRRFTFRGVHAHSGLRWGKFMASNLVGAGVNYAVFAVVLHLALSADGQTARLIALVAGTVAGLGLNYWMNHTVVFTHRAAAPRHLPMALIALLAVSIPHLLYALSKWYAIPLHEGIPIGHNDPDTWLRLTLVRDWLLGGSWYDHTVTGSNAPFAASTSPWTRPLDVVLALLVHLQPETLEVSLRLMRASLLLPVLWMGLMILGIQRVIRAIMPLPSAWIMASALVVTLPMMWNYFTLGNADHHGPLAALFIWAMAGILSPATSQRLMLATGALLGLMLWISVEALMLIGLVYAWFGLRWLAGDAGKVRRLALLSTSTAATALAALFIERPVAAWFTPIYDSISIVQVCLLVLAALVAWVLYAVPTATLRQRLLLASASCIALVALMALSYPKLLLGPMVDVDPFIVHEFLPRISEAKPFYKVGAFMLIATLLIPLTALMLCLWPVAAKREGFYARETSLALVFFLSGTLLLYLGQQRWSYYLLPLAIATVAPLLGALFTPEHAAVRARWPSRALLALPPSQQAKKRLPFVLAVLGLPFVLVMVAARYEDAQHVTQPVGQHSASEYTQRTQRDGCYTTARHLIRSGELARALGNAPTTLLLPTDLATEILFFTPYRMVASNYHREGEGISYVWGSDAVSHEASLKAHLAKRGVNALFLCPLMEPKDKSLLQAYLRGAALPAWLKRVEYVAPAPRMEGEVDEETPEIESIPPLLLRVDGQ